MYTGIASWRSLGTRLHKASLPDLLVVALSVRMLGRTTGGEGGRGGSVKLHLHMLATWGVSKDNHTLGRRRYVNGVMSLVTGYR